MYKMSEKKISSGLKLKHIQFTIIRGWEKQIFIFNEKEPVHFWLEKNCQLVCSEHEFLLCIIKNNGEVSQQKSVKYREKFLRSLLHHNPLLCSPSVPSICSTFAFICSLRSTYSDGRVQLCSFVDRKEKKAGRLGSYIKKKRK